MSTTHLDNSSLLESLHLGLSENLADIDKAIGTFNSAIPLLCKNVLQLFSMFQQLEDQRNHDKINFEDKIRELKLHYSQTKVPTEGVDRARAQPLLLSEPKKVQIPQQQAATVVDEYECFFEVNDKKKQLKTRSEENQIDAGINQAPNQQAWMSKMVPEKKTVFTKKKPQGKTSPPK